jgi:hypothetical protein
MIKWRLLLIFCLTFSFIGCAAHYMALTKGQKEVDLRKKSIALLSIKTSNEYDPTRQIDLIGVIVCPKSEEPCSNPRPYLHKANSAFKFEKDRYNEYLLSLELEPGIYYLDSAGLIYQKFVTETGGYAPLKLEIEIMPNTVSYLGHINIVLREKKNENEKTAGREVINLGVFSTELNKKSIVGFSAGTCDVVVEDKFDEDMKLFISEYPALQKAKVDKTILPQWKRPENQETK